MLVYSGGDDLNGVLVLIVVGLLELFNVADIAQLISENVTDLDVICNNYNVILCKQTYMYVIAITVIMQPPLGGGIM